MFSHSEKISSSGFIMKCLFAFLLALQAWNCLQGQTYPLKVIVVVTPPYSTRISDYTNTPNKIIVTVINLTAGPAGKTCNFYMLGSISSDAGVSVATDPSYMTPRPIQLLPSQTYTLTLQDVQALYDANHLVYNGITQQQILQNGGFPEGLYTICVRAYDFQTHQPLSDNNPSGCTSFNVRNLEVPILQKPVCGDTLWNKQQTVIFSWIPPAGSPPTTMYRLRIVELLARNQIPPDAFYTAPPNPSFETTTPAPVYIYTTAQPPLSLGRTYAYAVQAFDTRGLMYFRNNGWSVICSFFYEEPKSTAATNPKPVSIPPSVKNLTFFKGRITYAFRKSETGSSSSKPPDNTLASTPPQTGGFSWSVFEGNSGIPGTSSIPETGSGHSTPYTGSGIGNAGSIFNNSPHEKDQETIKSYASTEHYPLANTDVEIHMTLNPALSAFAGNCSGDILLGSTQTDGDGNFILGYLDDVPAGYEIKVMVKNDHFQFASTRIPMTVDENGAINTGELLGLPKSLKFRVLAVDENGTNLDQARVEILRPKGFYSQGPVFASLGHELMRDGMADSTPEGGGKGSSKGSHNLPNSSMLDLAARGPSGNVFPRGFYTDCYDETYYVHVSIGDLPMQEFSFRTAPPAGDFISPDVKTVVEAFTVKLPNPVVKGRVVTSPGDIPLAGADILIAPDDSTENSLIWYSHCRFARTDSNGMFTVEDIPVSQKPYVLKVIYAGKSSRDPKLIFLTKKGIIETRDPVKVDAALVAVCGIVSDAKGNPLPNASLHWKEGGIVFYSAQDGRFISSQTLGKHILITQLQGFHDNETEIVIKPDNEYTFPDSTVMHGPGVNQNLLNGFEGQGRQASAGNIFGSVLGLGSNGSSNSFSNGISYKQGVLMNIFGKGGLPTSQVSCSHIITMQKFFLKVKVTDDETKLPLVKAEVMTADVQVPIIADYQGIAILTDVPDFVPQQLVVNVNPQKDTSSLKVALTEGASVTGVVSSKGLPLAGATVSVQGRDFINAKTTQDGSYILHGVPAGKTGLTASMPGLVSADTLFTLEAGKLGTVNFSLGDPGFSATRLLGFNMTLDHSSPGSAPNEFVVSGRLTDIPDNPVFAKTSQTQKSIRFTNQKIIIENNMAYPESGELQTDESQLPLKFFGFLDVLLTNNNGLKVRQVGNDHSKGEIYGNLSSDIKSSFPSLPGLSIPQTPLNMLTAQGQNPATLNSSGSSPTSAYSLRGSIAGWQIYNISLLPDFQNSLADSGGISLKGTLSISNLPLLGSVTLKMNRLHITRTGTIDQTDIDVNPKPSISLGPWKLNVSGATLDQFGIKLGGDMNITIPGSPDANIGFSDIGLSSTGLTGGSFYLPGSGLNIFNVASFLTSSSGFSLEKLTGSSQYQFVGPGKIQLSKYITIPLSMDNFSVTTDAKISGHVSSGLKVGFDELASLGVSSVDFNQNGPSIDVSGGFMLNIPGLGIEAEGTAHYTKSIVILDKLSVNWDLMSGVSAKSVLSLQTSPFGFTGDGNLSIAGSSLIGLDFHYLKQQGGMDVGASFKSDAVIPIGLVKIDKLGGGFNFNTATNIYNINANGSISFIIDPTDGLLSLDPVAVSVTATPGGPVLQGSATLKAIDSWDMGNASLVIDYPSKLFTIDGSFGHNFSLIRGITIPSNSGSLEITACSATSDKYWLVAGNASVTIPNLVDNISVNVAAGWNVPKSGHQILSAVPDEVLTQGKLYGGYISVGITLINKSFGPVGFAGLADVSASLLVQGNASVWANFKQGSFVMNANASGSGNISACFIHDLGCTGIGISCQASLTGSYYSGDWAVSGQASACGSISIGCDCDCNDWCTKYKVIPCGARLCIGAGGSIGFSSSKGFSYDLNFTGCSN
jgi:TANFOR domain-containing protein